MPRGEDLRGIIAVRSCWARYVDSSRGDWRQGGLEVLFQPFLEDVLMLSMEDMVKVPKGRFCVCLCVCALIHASYLECMSKKMFPCSRMMLDIF